jgi:ABC-type Fe3+ transport system substrate-binding protein
MMNLDKLLGPKWLKIVEGWAKNDPRVGRSLADNIQPLTSGEVQVAIGYIKDKFQYPGPIEYVRMNKYLASLSFLAINRQAPRPNAARLFTEFFVGRKRSGFSAISASMFSIPTPITNSKRT